MKKVSIIIPHLPGTRKEYLKEAIKGIDEQVYPNIELILVSKNQSEVNNIREGLKRAKGEIIHIHHDDDWFTPNSVQNAVDFLTPYDLIHGKAHEINGKDYTPPIKYPTLKELVSCNVIHNATIFYRRDLFDRVGEYEQDWLFSLKCLEKGMKIGYCPFFLKNYRLHPESLSNSTIWIESMRPHLVKIVKERYGPLLSEAR